MPLPTGEVYSMYNRLGGRHSKVKECPGGRSGDMNMPPIQASRPFEQLHTPTTLFCNSSLARGILSGGRSVRLFSHTRQQKELPPFDNLLVLTDHVRKFLEIHFRKIDYLGLCNLSLLIENLKCSSSLDVLSTTEATRLLAAVNELDHPNSHNECITFEDFLSRLRCHKQEKLQCAPANPQDSWAITEKEKYLRVLSSIGEEDYLIPPAAPSVVRSGRGVVHNTYRAPNAPSTTSTGRHHSTNPDSSSTNRSSVTSIQYQVDAAMQVMGAVTSPRSSCNNSSWFLPANSVIAAASIRRAAAQQAKVPAECDSMEVDGGVDMGNRYEAVFARIDQRMAEKPSRRPQAYDSSSDEEGESTTMEITGFEEEERVRQLLAIRHRPLTQAQEDRVSAALSPPHDESNVVKKYKIDMCRRKISCLLPHTWLNDEVINFYMCMLMDRDEALCSVDPKRQPSHYYNSFFMNKLVDQGGYQYAPIRRWSKKFNILEKRRVYCPINIANSHWTLAVIHMDMKKVVYYDSMGGSGTKYMNALLNYVIDDAKDKKNVTLERSEWTTESAFQTVPDLPQQQNGVDCGMFTVMYADFLTDDLPLSLFSQRDILGYRRKVVSAILDGKLNYGNE